MGNEEWESGLQLWRERTEIRGNSLQIQLLPTFKKIPPCLEIATTFKKRVPNNHVQVLHHPKISLQIQWAWSNMLLDIFFF